MSELNAEKMALELSRRGHDWADKDAAYFALEETKKDVLAECMSKVNDHKASQAAKEQQARIMPEWKDHQKKLAAARQAMNLAKVDYTVYQAFMELRRSEEATTRAAMTLR